MIFLLSCWQESPKELPALRTPQNVESKLVHYGSLKGRLIQSGDKPVKGHVWTTTSIDEHSSLCARKTCPKDSIVLLIENKTSSKEAKRYVENLVGKEVPISELKCNGNK